MKWKSTNSVCCSSTVKQPRPPAICTSPTSRGAQISMGPLEIPGWFHGSNSLAGCCTSLWQKLEKRSPLNQPRFFCCSVCVFFCWADVQQKFSPEKPWSSVFVSLTVRYVSNLKKHVQKQCKAWVWCKSLRQVEVFQVVNNHMVQHRYVESDCLKLLLFSVVKKNDIYIYIYIY